jgi:hypothetical protein
MPTQCAAVTLEGKAIAISRVRDLQIYLQICVQLQFCIRGFDSQAVVKCKRLFVLVSC